MCIRDRRYSVIPILDGRGVRVRVAAVLVALGGRTIEFVVLVGCCNRRGTRLVGQGRGLRDEIAVGVVGVANRAGLGVGSGGDP